MIVNGKQVKIIQFEVIADGANIDCLVGLGDDGVMYFSDPKQGFWEIYIEDHTEDEHESSKAVS